MYLNFEQVMLILEEWGVADILLPFLLIFTIVFAVLQKTKILGKDSEDNPHKNMNVVIALIMGLAVVIPHATGRYSSQYDVVDIMNNALPGVSLVLVGILMAMMLLGIFGSRFDLTEGPVGSGIAVLMVLIVIGIFASAAGWFTLPGWLYFLNNPETQTTFVVIAIFALIVWFITKDDTPRGDKKEFTIKGLKPID
jgi:hypothetical protein